MIYWLEVRVKDGVAASSAGRRGSGRTTSMDDAVWDFGSELPRTWQELRYPAGHPYHGLEANSIDLAFALTFTDVAGPAGLGRRAGSGRAPPATRRWPSTTAPGT